MVTASAIWVVPFRGGHNRHPTVSITTQLTVLQRTIFRPADGGDADELGPVSVEVVWRVRRDLLVDADQGPVFDQTDLKKTESDDHCVKGWRLHEVGTLFANADSWYESSLSDASGIDLLVQQH